MYVQRNIEARSCEHCCSGKAIIITYSEFVFVVFAIQHEMRMSRIILAYVACLDIQYFRTTSLKRHDFRKNLSNVNIFFYFLYNISPKYFSF